MRAQLQAAVRALLSADPALSAEVAAIGEAEPLAAHPCLILEEPQLADWGTKDAAGREARCAVTVRDIAATPERVRRLADAVEAALASFPRSLGEGWSTGGAAVLRSRVQRERGRAGDVPRWTASVEFRVRMLRDGQGDE